MDPTTIREARRIIRDLILKGAATLQSGRVLTPDDMQLVTLLEKTASKKVEEVDVPQTVEGFTPQVTYKEIMRETPQGAEGREPQAG